MSLLALLFAATVGRPYHEVALRDLALGKVRQTHIRVEGFVTYLAREQDGDLHIRLCERADIKTMQRDSCLVAECIPAMPCVKPDIGSRVAVEGISRFDKENGHRWSEVHPVERLEVLTP